jgi:hypothetical protein
VAGASAHSTDTAHNTPASAGSTARSAPRPSAAGGQVGPAGRVAGHLVGPRISSAKNRSAAPARRRCRAPMVGSSLLRVVRLPVAALPLRPGGPITRRLRETARGHQARRSGSCAYRKPQLRGPGLPRRAAKADRAGPGAHRFTANIAHERDCGLRRHLPNPCNRLSGPAEEYRWPGWPRSWLIPVLSKRWRPAARAPGLPPGPHGHNHRFPAPRPLGRVGPGAVHLRRQSQVAAFEKLP